MVSLCRNPERIPGLQKKVGGFVLGGTRRASESLWGFRRGFRSGFRDGGGFRRGFRKGFRKGAPGDGTRCALLPVVRLLVTITIITILSIHSDRHPPSVHSHMRHPHTHAYTTHTHARTHTQHTPTHIQIDNTRTHISSCRSADESVHLFLEMNHTSSMVTNIRTRINNPCGHYPKHHPEQRALVGEKGS